MIIWSLHRKSLDHQIVSRYSKEHSSSGAKCVYSKFNFHSKPKPKPVLKVPNQVINDAMQNILSVQENVRIAFNSAPALNTHFLQFKN